MSGGPLARLAAWWRRLWKPAVDDRGAYEAVQRIRADNLEAEANRQRQFPGGM